MKLSKESKIGITVVLALGFLYWGIHYLRGLNLLKPNRSYFVCYTHTDGLATSAPVTLDGFQVGVVEDIRYQYDRPGHILVRLTLDKHLSLPCDSRAVLTPALMGSPSVVLELGSSKRYALHGDTIASAYGNGLLEQLSEELLPGLETTVKRLNHVLAEVESELSDTGSLHATLRELSATGTHLRQLSGRLDLLVENDLPPILSDINTLSGNLAIISGNLSTIDFAATVGRVDDCLVNIESVLAQFTRTDNSLGLLLNDTTVYFNINHTVESADRLLTDLKEHPKRYVHFSLFGGKKQVDE